MWDELPPFLVRLTAGMCSLIHFGGKVAAASGAVFLPRFLLGKRPEASVSISCLTQITCSSRDQSHAKNSVQFFEKVRFFFSFCCFEVWWNLEI